MHLERHNLPARKSEIWMLARRPREPVPVLHTTQPNAEDRRGILQHVRMRVFKELRDGNRRGRNDIHVAIGSVEGDRIGGLRQAAPWNIGFAEKIQSTAGVHKPTGRATVTGWAMDRRQS